MTPLGSPGGYQEITTELYVGFESAGQSGGEAAGREMEWRKENSNVKLAFLELAMLPCCPQYKTMIH